MPRLNALIAMGMALLLSAPAVVAQKADVATSDTIIERLQGKCPKEKIEDIGCRQGAVVFPPEETSSAPPGKVDLYITFKTGSDTILPAAERQLHELLKAFRDSRLSTGRYEIAGHTDAEGGAAYNHDLSLRRARAVRRYLEANNIPTDRFRIAGYGFDDLRDPARPLAEINRRVEIRSLD